MSRTTKKGGASDRTPRVVVVVEDDADLRELYTAYLESEGFSVTQAANGLEALLQIKRVRPTSVVLDLLMPRLGGLEALRRIKAFDASILVVVVTGVEDPAIRRQALTLGASAVLEKPVTLETLRSAVIEASPSSSPVSDAPKTVASPTRTGHAGRVLVVDDEADVCTILEEFLTARDYQVRSVGDGAAALRQVIEEAPNLVLLDVDMPRLGGIEALTAIRGLAPDVKVVMISGRASRETAMRALAYGAFDYITKPFDLDHLGEVVAAAFLWEG
jgi:DNA-binding response OmpR family regulator